MREGQADAGVQKLLAERYVRVYLDADTEAGRQLAATLGVSGQHGLVISDRSGGVMAFRHDGDLPAQDLARRLEKYADPDLTVKTTETVCAAGPAAESVPELRAGFRRRVPDLTVNHRAGSLPASIKPLAACHSKS